MSRRTAQALSLVALAQWLCFVACLTTNLWLVTLAHALTPDIVAIEVAFFCFATMGAYIAARRPDNLIGWLFVAIGVGTAITSFEGAYAAYAANVLEDLNAPTFRVLDWLGNCVWPINLGLGVFILFLFPTGHLPSRRWRFVAWLAAVSLAGQVLASAFTPGPFSGETTTNPFGVPGAAPLMAIVNTVSHLVFILTALVAVVAVIGRFVRARGEQRQQLKWFAYGVALAALLIAGSIVLLPERAGNLAFAAAFASLPLGAGIAVLRYRLTDIDLLIRRTLIYGSLSGILAAVYFSAVIAAQAIGQAVTRVKSPPDVVIVATTLLIAGLFMPLRRRLQAFIDRRFYRRKYDAAKTLAAFGTTLQTETDLPALSQQLVGVVRETMQPASVSLWLRERGSREVRR
jgi:hypothetical protein